MISKLNRFARFVKGIFRYKLTAVFFITGQLIMFFAIFGALGIYNKAQEKENDRLEAMYQERIEMSVITLNKSDIFTEAADKVTAGNLLLAGSLVLDVAEAGVNTRAEVLLAVNEELPYKLLEGHIPGTEESDFGKKLVALGRDKYKYAYEEDGKHWITIASEVYEVCGVIGSEKSDYWDYKIVMNIGCIGEKTLDTIISNRSYTIELSSNIEDINSSYERVYSNIISLAPTSKISSKIVKSTGKSTFANTLAKENFKVNVIVYIFCILNSMVMSQFWIIQRKKELAIRKTFGMSNLRIILVIAGNVLSLILTAFIIFIVIISVMWMVNAEIVKWFAFNVVSFIVIIMTIILTAAVIMIYPIYRIIRFNPAVTLSDV